jgi:hypothetical protein
MGARGVCERPSVPWGVATARLSDGVIDEVGVREGGAAPAPRPGGTVALSALRATGASA